MKKIQTLYMLLGICLSFTFLSAQSQPTESPHRHCATMTLLREQEEQEPAMRERRIAIEKSTQEWIQRTPSVLERSVINIPVVVHVVYNTTAENISDAQIQSQINVLNRDFRRLNSEAVPAQFAHLAADVELTFCLAKTDPLGQATTGIERKFTTKTAWSSNDDMKRPLKEGLAAWDATAYLNIWVCNLGSSSLGYSSFPGAPVSLDGVVIDYRYFGTLNTRAPFNLGRTATHEVGHWLNLYHIWGDSQCGNDHVEDTPLHHGANYGCPAHPSIYTNCGSQTVEMPMNFMDYTNDACMSMFTLGQKARMKALFAVGGARHSFIFSRGCSTTTPSVCATPTSLNILNITESTARLTWVNNAPNLRSTTLEYRPSTSATWIAVSNIASNSFIINRLEANTVYFARIKTICLTTGESLFSETIAFKTNTRIRPPEPTDCADAHESNNSRSTAKLIPINADIRAAIGVQGDRDWFYFQVPTGRQFQVALTNLFADYDLKMYDSGLRLLRASENLGTTNEGFSFTAEGQTVFLLQVYGYNGAFNATQCYQLKVSTAANIAPHNPTTTRDTIRRTPIEERGLRVYPNPTTGISHIDISADQAGMAEISLINMTGQTLYSSQQFVSKTENTLRLDFLNYPNGLYLLSVKQGESVWTKRLMISK